MRSPASSCAQTASRWRSARPAWTSAISAARSWRDGASARGAPRPGSGHVTAGAAGPPPPGKVIAVHLNYRSRAAQRGRVPTEPSYFLKPPSSVSAGGDVVRPQGCELLAYEGEIAVIIGRAARGVALEEAPACIGWFAPANDLGAHDFRWADRGSNVLAKGQDGFTPIGPAAPAGDVADVAALRLRTTVICEDRPATTAADLIFSFG